MAWLVIQVLSIKLMWMASHKLAMDTEHQTSIETKTRPVEGSNTFCDAIFSTCTIMGETFDIKTKPLHNQSGQAVALVVSYPSNYREREDIREQIRKFNFHHSLGIYVYKK